MDYVFEVQSVLISFKRWTKSVKNFLVRLKEYVAYHDILGPYMSGLSQVSVANILLDFPI